MSVGRTPRRDIRVGGIDLAGVPERATGVCCLRSDGFSETSVVREDAELLSWVRSARVRLVLVDAPLSLPRGRTTLDRPEPFHFRECDRELRKLGIPFFPISLGPMRTLTRRGMHLAPAIQGAGVTVAEGYPGGAQDLWEWPRKQAGLERLRRALRRTGCWGAVDRSGLSHDELDAVTLALVARAHLRHRSIVLGDSDEGTMILPEPGTKPVPSLFAWTPRHRPRIRHRELPALPRDTECANSRTKTSETSNAGKKRSQC